MVEHEHDADDHAVQSGESSSQHGDEVPDPFEGPDWSGARSANGDRIRVRRRRSSRKRRIRRRILIGAGVLGLVVVAAVCWLLYSGFKARSELQAVRDGVRTMRAQISAGDLDAARATAEEVRADADAAHSHTSGPLWALAGTVPYFGDPVDTARTLTSSVQLVADQAMTPLIDVSNDLQPRTLRTPDGAFDLSAIEQLAPTLHRATGAMDVALDRTRSASGSTWLGSVNAARQQLLDQLMPLRATVAELGRAMNVVPTLLGADGPRTYLISFQNDAEIRATGGLPGAFAVVRADNGKISFTHFESDTFFAHVHANGLDFGRDFSQVYETATADYRDSNYSSHFPYAAQIWSSMWQQKTGGRLDGAMVIDPTALSYLLAVTGPVPLADGTQLTADNVVSLSEQTLYERYPLLSQVDERKAYLLDLAEAVSQKLFAPGTDVARLVRAGGRAAGEHRLLFWSRDPDVEKEILDLPLSGVLLDTNHPYVALALNNDSQSKLDYYLHASMDWRRTGCGPTRDVQVTVKITNDAPATLPAYVVGNSFPPGTETLDVGLYGSIGGRFTKVRVNGRAPFYVSGHDQGHPVFIVSADIPRGKTTTVVYELTEPAGVGDVIVRNQPMINPMTVTVHDPSC